MLGSAVRCSYCTSIIVCGSTAGPFLGFGDADGGGRIRKDLGERDD